jgi:hypothetical protein
MAIQTQFSTDPNAIVTVNVSIVEAPTPNTYQRSGAFVSFGATMLAKNDSTLLTQLADLTPPTPLAPVLVPPMAITNTVWTAGVVTVTTTSPIPGPPIVGDTFTLVLAGYTPAAYNGRVQATVTGPSAFTYPLATNPGVVTAEGTATWGSAIELSQMATTYFGQGNEVGVWVLELGYQSSFANRVVALQGWLTNNPLTIYGFLLPREFGANPNIPNWPGFPTPAPAPTTWMNLLKQYENPEAMEYFWITIAGSANMNTLGPTYKDVLQLVEAPTLTDPLGANINDPNGEFTMAAMFYNAIVYRPSNTNRIAPMAFKYVYGVTEYPQRGNGPLLVAFKGANTNYISTGAEGGISFTMVYEGVTLDGMDYFNWWYTIDWVQIQVNLDLSNAIINGSNNPLAPLYYNQDGINYLETVLYSTMQSAQTFGMVLGKIEMTQLDGPDLTAAIFGGTFAGKCDINAVPFLNYTLANPGDYKIGEYDGLSALFIPARGFIHILVNIVASDLISI